MMDRLVPSVRPTPTRLHQRVPARSLDAKAQSSDLFCKGRVKRGETLLGVQARCQCRVLVRRGIAFLISGSTGIALRISGSTGIARRISHGRITRMSPAPFTALKV